MNDWHRKQRKKEIQKNKASRIAARDEKVKSEKSERSVLEEIRKLERQFKNQETRPHSVQSKLDRLQKELKLVKEEAAKNKKAPPRKNYENNTKKNFQPLENPKLSVYYDPVMNPFGTPPPGKPKLYHRRDGGVTMNLEEAGMPGEAPPPPPRPPPPKALHRAPKNVQTDKHSSDEKLKDNQRREPSQPQSSREGKDTTATQTSQTKQRTTAPPSLPPPSAAVRRMKRKLATDIWASTEEIEYEEATGATLEGVAEHSPSWWYKDTVGLVQGPYPTEQMKQWVDAGFFPDTTLVRSSQNSLWKELRCVGVFEKTRQASSVQDRIAALRQEHGDDDTGASVQDRIDTLRQHVEQQEQSLEGEENAVEMSVQDRIAALRQQHMREQGATQEPNVEHVAEEQQSENEQLVTLRHELTMKTGQEEGNREMNETSVHDRIAVLRVQLMKDQQNGPAEDNEASWEPATNGPLPPPPPPPPVGPSAGPHQGGLLPPPPPPPHSADQAVGSYPLDGDVSYPVDDDDMLGAYPIDEATSSYPGGDAGEDVSFPIAGAYPIDDDNTEPPPVKKVKVEKDLTAFVPSNVRRKRYLARRDG